MVKKYWVSGVLPVFRDVDGPLFTMDVILDLLQYNGLCDLKEEEVKSITATYLQDTHPVARLTEELWQRTKWYGD